MHVLGVFNSNYHVGSASKETREVKASWRYARRVTEMIPKAVGQDRHSVADVDTSTLTTPASHGSRPLFHSLAAQLRPEAEPFPNVLRHNSGIGHEFRR